MNNSQQIIFALQIFGKEIKPILKKVSRSFYLSLKILPKKLRNIISLAYLLARAGDTIADTKVFSGDLKLKWLKFLKQEVENPYEQSSKLWNSFQTEQEGQVTIPEEKELLDILPHLTGVLPQYPRPQQEYIQEVVSHLLSGMEKNILYFENQNTNLKSFESISQLEEYCFDAAGIVGKFWTKTIFIYYSSKIDLSQEKMIKLGINFGNGLQMINILKDIFEDLKNGRNYISIEILDKLNLNPHDLLAHKGGKELLKFFIPHTLNLLKSGQSYLLHLPRLPLGLRLSVILPLWIGLDTLLCLVEMKHYLSPDEIYKIPRRKVKMILLKALLCFFSDSMIQSHFLKMEKKILEKI